MPSINPASLAMRPLAAAGAELLELARPGFEPALRTAVEVLGSGGDRAEVYRAATSAFVSSEAGKALGHKALSSLAPLLDELVKHPQVAAHWGRLAKVAGQSGEVTRLLSKALVGPLGAQGSKLVGRFCEKLLKVATSKGFAEAIKVATKGAPALLKVLGGLGKLVPGLGLAASLISAVKVFADPNCTQAQKLAAVLDVAAGVLGVIPGVGTTAQVAVSLGATGISLAADAFAP